MTICRVLTTLVQQSINHSPHTANQHIPSTNMTWNPIEATPPHRIYLILSIFLIYYALFSNFIRNRLHLSEPPLALVLGILLGPRCFDILSPNKRGVSRGGQGIDDDGGWGWGDDIVQEVTRVIVGIQVFATGIELPKYYMSRHWKSIAMLLGKCD